VFPTFQLGVFGFVKFSPFCLLPRFIAPLICTKKILILYVTGMAFISRFSKGFSSGF
jgi:hypothetical protein